MVNESKRRGAPPREPTEKPTAKNAPSKESTAKSKPRKSESYTKDEPLVINTHRELRGSIRLISQRFNDRPDLARMILVNPLLALEDLGVRLTPELKQHVMDALRFPAQVVERRDKLELELHDELAALGVSYRPPLSAAERADLMFRVLKLKPDDSGTEQTEAKAYAASAREAGEETTRYAGEEIARNVDDATPPVAPEEIAEIRSRQMRRYARQHPLVAKLAEYERLRQGRLVFYPREVYEQYKAGLKRQTWIKAVRFKV